ncbi:unnamed protein product [Closterium sp. NIES-54]
MQRCSLPISCSAFNHDGTIFGYAVSYDWSKGAENHNPAVNKNYILLHATQDATETEEEGAESSSHSIERILKQAADAFSELNPSPRLPPPFPLHQDATETEEEGTDSAAVSIERILKQAADAYQSEDEAAVATVEAQLRAMEADRQGLAERLESLTTEWWQQWRRSCEPWRPTARASRGEPTAEVSSRSRKRSEREKLAMAATVRSDVVEALLPMIDSFERAKDSVKVETEAEKKIDGAYQGIYRQFVEVLRGLGVAAVETVGKEFDPNVHDAIMREDSTEFPEGVVTQEFRKGFVIGEKLIRPSMVKVSAGPGPSGAGEAAAADGAAAAGDGVSDGSEAEGGEKSE